MRIYSVPRTLRAIIFDIDSTLYTNPAYALEQVDCQIRRYADLRGMTHQEARNEISAYRSEWGAQNGGRKISLGNTLAALGVPIEESIRWREELLEPARFLRTDSRLADALALLGRRFSLICVTNNPQVPARKTLDALGVGRFFPDVVSLDTCGVSKPHRAPLDLAAERAGAEIRECLSVGDRYDIDIALPLEMGMGGILVDGVEDVYKIPGLLE